MTKKLKDICRNNWFYLVCGILILIQVMFSLRFMGRQFFSLDEVSQIGFIAKKNSWGKIIDYYLTSEVTNLPLWPLLAAVWYRVVPYGEGWMRLITVILTTIAIVLMIKMAKAYRGERTAVIMATLVCISSLIMQKCGLTFRVHAFWIAFTALVMWRYIERLKSLGYEKTRDVVLLGFSMAGLAYSHYFGCLTIVYLFCMDACLFVLKKIKGKFFISYMIGGGSLMPWFLLMITKRTMNLEEFWPKTPTFASIPKALRYILSHDEVIYLLLILAMIVAALLFIDCLLNEGRDFEERFVRLGFAFMPLLFVVGDYIYSAHINTKSGIFVLRYFLSVLPAALLSVSIVLEEILDRVSEKFSVSKLLVYGSVLSFMVLYLGTANYYYDVKDEVSAPFDNTYGNVRDYIVSEGRLGDKDTMIAINANRANADGFEEYYLEYGGKGEDIHVVSNDDTDMAERIAEAEHIYIYQVMKGTPDVFTDLMGDDFKETAFDENIGLYVYERVSR